MNLTWSPHPEIFSLGPIVLKWYGFMYVLGFFLAYLFYRYLINKKMFPLKKEELPDLLITAFLGLLIGARLFYMVFYHLPNFIADPLSIFYIWNGGMSFHGGLLGVILALIYFLKKRKIPLLAMGDLLILPLPLALFFGRLGNFMNSELAGRVADPNSPLCIVYTNIDSYCRYPSQLIEAGLEGLVLFCILLFAFFKTPLKNSAGRIFGLFLTLYACARMTSELFREPDAQLGFIIGHISMGQLLSLPMLILGLYFLFKKTYASPYTRNN